MLNGEECRECGRMFKNKQSLRVHRCKNCKGRPETIHPASAQPSGCVDAQLQELRDQLQKVTLQLQHVQNQQHMEPNISVGNQNSHNTTNNNVVIVNGFGNESLDHITTPFLDQCVRRRDKGLIELIEKIHFDPEHKENRNVRATNVKGPVMRVHDGTCWKFKRKSKVLNDIVDKSHGMMQEHMDDNEERLRNDTPEYMFRHIQEWMEKMQDRDKRILEDVLADIYVLVLNEARDLQDV
jgi:hypothetical protein